MTPVQKFALKRIAVLVAVIGGIVALAATGALDGFLADESAPQQSAPKTEAAAPQEPGIPGWKPWLAEMSGIWADGSDQRRFFFSPKGILIEDVERAGTEVLFGQMRPTIKGTDDDNDVVVLNTTVTFAGTAAATAKELVSASGINTSNVELVVRRIWDSEHKLFTLHWTLGNDSPTELGFVRRFLPDEIKELTAKATAPQPVLAKSPTVVEPPVAQNEPSAPATPQEQPSEGQTTSFEYVQEGVDGGLDIMEQKDGRVDARLNTVTKGNYHVCEFNMTALSKKAGFGWDWKDDNSNCHVEIGGSSNALEIHGSQECYANCGMNGAFEGSYRPQPKTNR